MAGGAWKAALLGAALAGGAAWGQEQDEPGQLRGALEEAEVAVRVDGGVGNFLGDLNTHTEAGPTWGVALSADRWNLFGVELAYEGSRHTIDNRLAPSGAAIWRNGVSGLAKVGPQLTENVRPYLGAGVGVSYVNPNELAEAGYQNDFIAELPLAVGVDLERGNLKAGVRTTYRFLGGEEFAAPAGVGQTEGGLLTATVNIGGRF